MPYIRQDLRERLDDYTALPATSGELNYLITTIIRDYYTSGFGGYAAINDIIGALEGAKMEFYRRVAAPYEDTKIRENGDVYNV